MSNVTSNPSPDPYGLQTGGAGDIEIPGGLSPDALMTYCESRLKSINDQVQTSFDKQQRTASDIQQINAFASDLQAKQDDINDRDTCTALETEFQGVIKSIQATDPGCTALPALIKTYNAMVWSGDGGSAYTGKPGPDFISTGGPGDNDFAHSGGQGDGILDKSELQAFTTSINDATSNLNSGSELQMVQLQSLMSQRQTAISLTTNLLQSLGDQEEKIAENIGH
jgi:hypothetical protein